MLKQYDDLDFKEAANITHNVFQSATGTFYDFVMKNSPRLKVKSEKLEDDFRYCLEEDLTHIVPYLSENKLVI